MIQPTKLGLYDHQGRARGVLRGIDIQASLRGLALEATVAQTFINDGEEDLEAVYTFPLPDQAAICHFEAISGTRVLTGEIHDAAHAASDYAETLESGGQALMLEEIRPDIFTVNVGRIRPGEAMTTRLRFVMQVETADRSARLSFPTTVAPRFIAQEVGLEAYFEDEQLNPPRLQHVPYGVRFQLDVSELGVEAVHSPSHDLQIGAWNEGRVTLGEGTAAANRDIVVQLELKQAPLPSVRVERGPDNAHYLGVTLQPAFPDGVSPSVPSEVYFVLDCSGSMNGPSIESAKMALRLCLRTLAIGDTFNICRFGSRHDFFAPEPVVYSEDTLQQALAFVEGTTANFGGTQLKGPLQDIFQTATVEGRKRQVILLTDGQVSNENELIALARRNQATHRMFTFGIGAASSQHLVRGLARATGGVAEYLANGEAIDGPVLRTFGRMGGPSVQDVHINWGADDVTPGRDAPPVLYEGDSALLLARCPELPREMQVSYVVDGERFAGTLPLPAAQDEGGLHALWARTRIEYLADHADRVALSQRHRVLCSDTAFLAIEHASLEDRASGRPPLHRVPLALPENEVVAVMCAAPPPPAAAAPEGLLHRRSVSRGHEPAPQTPPNPLHALLDTQTARGTFTQPAPDIDVAIADQTLAAFGELSEADREAVLNTLHALRTLKESFAAEQQTWQRASNKAIAALCHLLGCSEARLREVYGGLLPQP